MAPCACGGARKVYNGRSSSSSTVGAPHAPFRGCCAYVRPQAKCIVHCTVHTVGKNKQCSLGSLKRVLLLIGHTGPTLARRSMPTLQYTVCSPNATAKYNVQEGRRKLKPPKTTPEHAPGARGPIQHINQRFAPNSPATWAVLHNMHCTCAVHVQYSCTAQYSTHSTVCIHVL